MRISDKVAKAVPNIFISDDGDDFCDEHIKRGWALKTLTPEALGFDDTDIIRLTNPLQNVH